MSDESKKTSFSAATKLYQKLKDDQYFQKNKFDQNLLRIIKILFFILFIWIVLLLVYSSTCHVIPNLCNSTHQPKEKLIQQEPLVETPTPPVIKPTCDKPIKPTCDIPKNRKATVKLCGSDTLGSKLTPDLVNSFLKKNYTAVKEIPDNDHTIKFQALTSDGDNVTFLIDYQGTKCGFEMLYEKQCDIVMASRKITEDEKLSLEDDFKDKSDEQSEKYEIDQQSEIHIASDGIAIIVNPDNPIDVLSPKQLKNIYTGKVKVWGEIFSCGPYDTRELCQDNNTKKLTSQKITVYSRPQDTSGTFDLFKRHFGLGAFYKNNQAIQEIKDGEDLSTQICDSSKLNSIGFVSSTQMGNAKPVAIKYDESAHTQDGESRPDSESIQRDNYIFARQLFFYIPKSIRDNNEVAKEFVEYTKAQRDNITNNIFVNHGFVPNKLLEPEVPNPVFNSNQSTPPVTQVNLNDEGRYQDLRDKLKKPITLLHFKSCSSALDNQAEEAIERLSYFFEKHRYSKVYVVGHTDDQGDEKVNDELSGLRAETVAEQLKIRNIKLEPIIKIGPSQPLVPNDTLEGREKNRRVEIWVELERSTVGF